MTHNQIDYAKLQETKRANRAQETENIRWHDMSEALGYSQLAEQARGNTLNYESNMASIAQRQQAAAWSHEENVRNLDLREMDISHTINIDSTKVGETERHNVATEGLTKRAQNIDIANTVIRGVDVAANVVGKVLGVGSKLAGIFGA